jgi:hypothetical protein
VTTTTPGSLPVVESAVAQVLLADKFTHSGVHPAVSERSPSTAVSVEYLNIRVSAVKIGDFDFNIELLISLVEARPVLWDKMDDMYKDRNEMKRHRQKFVFVFKKTLKL